MLDALRSLRLSRRFLEQLSVKLCKSGMTFKLYEAWDGRGHTLVETLPDSADGPDEAAMQASLVQVLTYQFKNLTERESEILRLRFGLGDDNDLTLEEVGFQFGVTRERIRQIEKSALKRLRHPSRSDALRFDLGGPDGAKVRA